MDNVPYLPVVGDTAVDVLKSLRTHRAEPELQLLRDKLRVGVYPGARLHQLLVVPSQGLQDLKRKRGKKEIRSDYCPN